jgi:hypothetical protein
VVRAAAVSTQRRGKHVSAATVELQQKSRVFYEVLAKGLYNEEAGSNTYTVALRVVEGDEKGTQCLEV